MAGAAILIAANAAARSYQLEQEAKPAIKIVPEPLEGGCYWFPAERRSLNASGTPECRTFSGREMAGAFARWLEQTGGDYDAEQIIGQNGRPEGLLAVPRAHPVPSVSQVDGE